MPFANNIKSLRKQKGWNQEEASNAIGIKRHNLGAYEEARAEPKFEVLKKIILTYEINQQEIFTFLYGTLPIQEQL